jgi:serine/threonine protein kinase
MMDDSDDLEELEDQDKVIEESPNGRWTKLITEIHIQRLVDFDSTHLAIDTDRGCEVAWNEMKFSKVSGLANRFDSATTLHTIYERLTLILQFLIKLDHSNILKFFDYWFVDGEMEAKLVVITEYTAAGSLRKVLDSAKMSRTRVKPSTFKRWLTQILYSIKYLHSNEITMFQVDSIQYFYIYIFIFLFSNFLKYLSERLNMGRNMSTFRENID